MKSRQSVFLVPVELQAECLSSAQWNCRGGSGREPAGLSSSSHESPRLPWLDALDPWSIGRRQGPVVRTATHHIRSGRFFPPHLSGGKERVEPPPAVCLICPLQDASRHLYLWLGQGSSIKVEFQKLTRNTFQHKYIPYSQVSKF